MQMVGQKQALLAALPAGNPLLAGRSPPTGAPNGAPAATRAMAAQAALDREVRTASVSPSPQPVVQDDPGRGRAGC